MQVNVNGMPRKTLRKLGLKHIISFGISVANIVVKKHPHKVMIVVCLDKHHTQISLKGNISFRTYCQHH